MSTLPQEIPSVVSRAARLKATLTQRPQLLLGSMLLALHLAIAWGLNNPWSQALMLAHFGFFLMWQPVWRSENRLGPIHIAFIIAIAGSFMLWNNWWQIALWLGVLIGIIGGTVLGIERPRHRFAYLLALTYLLSMLLIMVAPQLFSEPDMQPLLLSFGRYGLGVLPLFILLIPVEKYAPPLAHPVDFFYSLVVFLLVVIMLLGSFAIKMTSRSNYPFALAQALMVIAVGLVILSWLWNPRAGFAGFGQLLSRYVLSVGLPFERWLQSLASLAEREPEPISFLVKALEEISKLPWVSGGKWRSPGDKGEFGHRTDHRVEFTFHQFSLVLYTRWELSPALTLHVKLLTHLLGYFYESKLREKTLKQNTYTQAIYETGARLTHDIKNLLQSLTTLCAAAQNSEADQARALQALMQRQLPQITNRLQRCVENLQAPHQIDKTEIEAGQWWRNLQQRYTYDDIVFKAQDLDDATPIPTELFDSVADNLIQNALHKRKTQGELQIEAIFTGKPLVSFMVCDDGASLNGGLVKQLFEVPLPSNSGLGVGLYHAARQAAEVGCQLTLKENRQGRVCFELAKE